MADISATVSSNRPQLDDYEALYKHLHANPELSFVESETAALISSRLKDLGIEHRGSIGGHGIAATIANGQGPTVLLRADFDGLPVEEKTGLEYASKKRMKDAAGKEQPCMHACGHDVHVTALLAAADLLLRSKDAWSGTVLLIFQPAEEKGAGARAMVEDGLYTQNKAPVPDVAFGAHVMPHRAGYIGMQSGVMASACDAFKVTLHGQGGHASQPHQTVDPVVMAANVVNRLQTVVSREVNPTNPAVVTVASIHAGETENVIAETAELKINIRTYSEQVRKDVLAAVKRIINAESEASGALKAPTFDPISDYPLTKNDPEVTERLGKVMSAHFGDTLDLNSGYLGGSEDFAHLATSVDKPYCYFIYGGVDPKKWDEAEKNGRLKDIPINHSAFFAPVIQPTLTVAIDAYAIAALTWLKKD